MNEVTTADDFDALSWHDNTVYGLRWHVGDAARGDWRHDLAFDIDHIVDWVTNGQKGMRFRVAPATLTFHEVTDLRLAIDFGDSNYGTAIHDWSIDRISRELVDDAKRFPARDYFRWTIALNWPQGNEIAFGARGFTQTLRAEPVLLDEQRLPAGVPR